MSVRPLLRVRTPIRPTIQILKTTSRAYSTPTRPNDVDTHTNTTPASSQNTSTASSKTVHFKPLHSETKSHLPQNVQRDLTTTYLAPSAIVYGNVKIGSLSSIFAGAVVKGDINSITLGEKVSIHENAVIAPTLYHPVKIGSNVTIGAGTTIKGSTIGSNVFIGEGVVISSSVHIGDGTIVREASYVPHGMKLEGGGVYEGNPVKKVGDVDGEGRKKIEEESGLWVKVSRDHRLLLEKEFAEKGSDGEAHGAL